MCAVEHDECKSGEDVLWALPRLRLRADPGLIIFHFPIAFNSAAAAATAVSLRTRVCVYECVCVCAHVCTAHVWGCVQNLKKDDNLFQTLVHQFYHSSKKKVFSLI